MSFNVAMLKAMKAEGLDFDAAIRVLEAGERRADNTNAERQSRYRAKRKDTKASNAVTVTPVTPPNDKEDLTPREVSEPIGSSPQPWSRPDGVSVQVWADLLGNRKAKKRQNSPTAWKSFLDDLKRVSAESGLPPNKLIEHAAAQSWAGIYDPTKSLNGAKNGGNHQPTGIGSTERAMQKALASLEGRGAGAGFAS